MFFKITCCLESLFSLYLTHFTYMSYIFLKWSFSKFEAAKFQKIVVLFSSFLVDIVLELPSKFCSRSEVPIIFFGKQIFRIRPKSLKTHLDVPFKVFYYVLLLFGVSYPQLCHQPHGMCFHGSCSLAWSVLTLFVITFLLICQGLVPVLAPLDLFSSCSFSYFTMACNYFCCLVCTKFLTAVIYIHLCSHDSYPVPEI